MPRKRLEAVVLFCLAFLVLVCGGAMSVFFFHEGDWGLGAAGVVAAAAGTFAAVVVGLRRFATRPPGEKLGWPMRVVAGLMGLLLLAVGSVGIYAGVAASGTPPGNRFQALGMGVVTALLGIYALYYSLYRGEDPEMAERGNLFVPANPDEAPPEEIQLSGPVNCARCGVRRRKVYFLHCCHAPLCWKCLQKVAGPPVHTCELCGNPLLQIPEWGGPLVPVPAPPAPQPDPEPVAPRRQSSLNPEDDKAYCYFCGKPLTAGEQVSRVCRACRV